MVTRVLHTLQRPDETDCDLSIGSQGNCFDSADYDDADNATTDFWSGGVCKVLCIVDRRREYPPKICVTTKVFDP